MMETKPHACGVDDIARSHTCTNKPPSAWMMTLYRAFLARLRSRYCGYQLRRAFRPMNELISLIAKPCGRDCLTRQNLRHRRSEVRETYHWYGLIS
jgi:hypothetical protein